LEPPDTASSRDTGCPQVELWDVGRPGIESPVAEWGTDTPLLTVAVWKAPAMGAEASAKVPVPALSLASQA